MSSSGSGIVSLRNVGKTFESGTVALNHFSLDVREGEFVSLLGPSGCGKSTVLRIIAGLSAPSGGSIEWPAGTASRVYPTCSNLDRRTRAGPSSDGRIGFVFQEPTLMPWACLLYTSRVAHLHAAG